MLLKKSNAYQCRQRGGDAGWHPLIDESASLFDGGLGCFDDMLGGDAQIDHVLSAIVFSIVFTLVQKHVEKELV